MQNQVTRTPLKPLKPAVALRRINRTLRKDGLALHKSRWDSRWIQSTGEYYIVDCNNVLVQSHVDLDFLVVETRCIRFNEFLCWPEEEGKEVTL